MMKPLLFDLCCGSGGWTDAFLDEGYDVIGFDILRSPRYRGQLVLQDIRTLNGWQLKNGVLIVASPPCDEFSRHDQPWTRARNPPPPDLSIVEACWRIARESELPIVLENVRGAQKFIGRSRFRAQGFHLWGYVPALMPTVIPRQKQSMSSSWKLERARVPYEIARHIAQVYKPAHLSRPTQAPE